MTREQAAEIHGRWVAEIESIEVGGMRRRCDLSRRRSDPEPGEIRDITLFERLGPLTDGRVELDYGHPAYSRWGARLAEIWEERMRWLGGLQVSPNRSVIGTARGDVMEYKVFTVWVSVSADAWVEAERARKICGLGI